MQAITNISIPQPCHQNWNDLTPADKGRHCQSCKKTVIDFTQMTSSEIISYLSNSGNVCGRFDDVQMQAVNTKLAIDSKSKFSWRRLTIAAAITSLFITVKASAQRVAPTTQQSPVTNSNILMGEPVAYKLVKGKIIGDDDKAPVPGASVTVKGTSIGTLTNTKGEFALSVPLSADSLTIYSIGYQNYEAKVDDLSSLSNCISLKMRTDLLGGIVVVSVKKPPLHKRFWNKVKKVFER